MASTPPEARQQQDRPRGGRRVAAGKAGARFGSSWRGKAALVAIPRARGAASGGPARADDSVGGGQ